MRKPRVLSGVQPTGNLHLGNYLGAIRNWVGLQDSHECLFMLADLHAITVPQHPADLTRNTRETAAAYIACGIDPKKSAIFPQSAVTMHAELAWILNCHTPLGWLNRMTQFKEKANIAEEGHDIKMQGDSIIEYIESLFKEVDYNNKDSLKALESSVLYSAQNLVKLIQAKERSEKRKAAPDAPLGLYAYPVLMAADILGYHATHVPVGEDQKQHLELARDIAGAFNRAYPHATPPAGGGTPSSTPPASGGGEGGGFFPLPQPLIMPTAARIMSLTDGTKKMSKSDPSDYSRITLMDDADAIAKKIKKAQTDSEPSLSYEPKTRPSVANLISIYAALADSTPEAVVQQFSDLKTGAFKAALAELAVEKLSPITARMRELMDDHTTLDAILKEGAERARAIATPIFEQVQQKVGFLRV